MSTTAEQGIANAGQAGWTRDLARDLFPGRTTPFAWTLLAAPAERALRNVYAELGGQAVAGKAFWRLDGGYSYLNALAVAEADQSLCGAGWLGRSQPHAPGGLRGRLQAGGVTKRCQARLAAAAIEANGLQTRLSRWLTWVQGVQWTQADLLQVMEELEPHALAALQTYFLARVALNVAAAALHARMLEFVPAFPPDLAAALPLGAPDLPSVATAEAVLDAARLDPADPRRLATLAKHGHRGPGEVRPDALRWSRAADLLGFLAAQGEPRWTRAGAAERRDAALGDLRGQLHGGQFRQVEESLGDLAAAMRTAELAWDSLILVMSAGQSWAGAAAKETLAAGLIVRPADVFYLELEELKQVATGEWHAGDKEEVLAAVARRMQEVSAAAPAADVATPVVICPGECDGPLYYGSPGEALPPSGAVWVTENVDPGCAPFWPVAGCLAAGGGDAWAPGLVVARGIGVPARLGAGPAAA